EPLLELGLELRGGHLEGVHAVGEEGVIAPEDAAGGELDAVFGLELDEARRTLLIAGAIEGLEGPGAQCASEPAGKVCRELFRARTDAKAGECDGAAGQWHGSAEDARGALPRQATVAPLAASAQDHLEVVGAQAGQKLLDVGGPTGLQCDVD